MGSGLCAFASKEERESRVEPSTRDSKEKKAEDLELTFRLNPVDLRLSPPVLARLRAGGSQLLSPCKPSAVRVSPKPHRAEVSVAELLRPHVECGSHEDSSTVYEGSVRKYKPGFAGNFVERFARATRTQFLVFRCKYAAEIFHEAALDVVDLSCIDHIQAFDYSARVDSEPQQVLSFFELYLKTEDPELLFSRQELSPSALRAQRLTARSIAAAADRGRLMRRPVRQTVTMKALHAQSWTCREMDWFAAEKRLLFSTERREEAEAWKGVLEMLCGRAVEL